MTNLPQASRAVLPPLDADLEQAVSYARAEKASSTRRAYIATSLCSSPGAPRRGSLPSPLSLKRWQRSWPFEANRGIRPSTITRRAASIRYAHKLRSHEPPTSSEAVRATLRGIRRSPSTAKVRKAPLLAETARAMAQAAPDGLKGLRDRALLLVGFAGAFRRSELVALDVADLEETEDGLRVAIRRSKTDQEGKGEVIAIVRGSMNCPVKAVKNWLEATSIIEGPLFRPVTKGRRVGNSRLTDKSVAGIIKLRLMA
jgi:integrase